MSTERTKSVPDNLDERLHGISERLWTTVRDDMGYGGPLFHGAQQDGWDLLMNTGDDGSLMFSANRPDERIFNAWEHAPAGMVRDMPEGGWLPCTVGTTRDDLAWAVPLAEAAEWYDKMAEQRGDKELRRCESCGKRTWATLWDVPYREPGSCPNCGARGDG